MSHIFNKFPSPGFYSKRRFRMAYSLLPTLRNLLSKATKTDDKIQVVSIACGKALEVPVLEMLARARGYKIAYFGYDIDIEDLYLGYKRFSNVAVNIKPQIYQQVDLARELPTPLPEIQYANCILWRHPEFISDGDETPIDLILNMCRILWRVLKYKNKDTPILITCFDPHEVMFVLELLKQFSSGELEYDLMLDKQPGRATPDNPLMEYENDGPLFNYNYHDQCQLLVTKCSLTPLFELENLHIGADKIFIAILAKSLQEIASIMPNFTEIQLSALSALLDQPDLEVISVAVTFLNNAIRLHDNPYAYREQLLSTLMTHYASTSPPPSLQPS